MTEFVVLLAVRTFAWVALWTLATLGACALAAFAVTTRRARTGSERRTNHY